MLGKQVLKTDIARVAKKMPLCRTLQSRLEFPLSVNITDVDSHNFVLVSERKSRNSKSI